MSVLWIVTGVDHVQCLSFLLLSKQVATHMDLNNKNLAAKSSGRQESGIKPFSGRL